MAGPRDNRLGRLALAHGYLTEQELAGVLAEQDALRARGEATRLGDLLVERRLLTEDQLGDLLDEAGAPGEAAGSLVAERQRRSFLYAGVGVTVVALLGVLAVLLTDTFGGGSKPPSGGNGHGNGDGPATARPVAARPESGGGPATPAGVPAGPAAGRPTAGPKATPEEQAARAAWAVVEQFITDHPTDVDGIEGRLRDIMERHPVIAADARARMKSIETRREQLAETVYTEKLKAGEAAYAKGDAQGALHIFDDFPQGLRGTSWYGKVAEWGPALHFKAFAAVDAAATQANELMQQGKVLETIAVLDKTRGLESLAATSDSGRVLVDSVAGLRGRAEWLARGEARKVLDVVVPEVLAALGRRDVRGAREALAGKVKAEANSVVRDEARLIESDIRGCERLLWQLEGRMRALAGGGAAVQLTLGGVEKTGILKSGGAGFAFETGDTTVPVALATLPPKDLVRLATDTRVAPIGPAGRFALALVLLGAGGWSEARDLLAEFAGPRARDYLARAESAGAGELMQSMGRDLTTARERLAAADWKALREVAEKLRVRVGWPVEGEHGPRREMADLWSRAETELLGLARLVAGAVSALPEGRLRVAYEFTAEEEGRDFEARGAAPTMAGRRLRVAEGTVAFHRLDFPGDVTVECRALGREFGVACAASASAEGYVAGFRGGELVLLRDGVALTRAPFPLDPTREYAVRLVRTGAKVACTVDGREVVKAEDPSPLAGRERCGVVGGPGSSYYAAVVLTGQINLSGVKAAADAVAKSRKPPRGTLPLLKGQTLEGWQPMRGEWSVKKDAIFGRGADAYLVHNELSRWDVTDYTLSVEVRRTLRRSDTPVVVFRVNGRDCLWIFGDQASSLSGLPGAAMNTGAEDISFKFKPVIIQVKKGIVRGMVGTTLIFEAKADGADGTATLGGALAGFGVGSKGGEVAFRNPVFKAEK